MSAMANRLPMIIVGRIIGVRGEDIDKLGLVTEDPSAQILSVWIVKEELRTPLSTVLRCGDAHLTRHRLHRFLDWCIDSRIPELLTPAATIDTWWPEINTFLTTGISNARTQRAATQTSTLPGKS